MGLVRNVFGKFLASATASGLSTSQNLMLFHAPSGQVSAFDFVSQTHQNLARQKAIGIFSHMQSQKSALQTVLKARSYKHVIVTSAAVLVFNFG